MGSLIRSLALLLIFSFSSRVVQSDKQVERLQKERVNLTRQTDPVGRTKTEIKISEVLLTLISNAVQAGDMELMQKYIDEYVAAIEDAHHIHVSVLGPHGAMRVHGNGGGIGFLHPVGHAPEPPDRHILRASTACGARQTQEYP